MKKVKQSWLLEMWRIKARGWREGVRLHASSAISLLRASLFPAVEMRRLDRLLSRRQRAREECVLRRTGRWFAVLDRLGMRPSCFVRSLTMARVLRKEGYDAHLVFGVRSDNGDMEGHCWVAVGERPVTEVPADFEELRYE